MMLAGAAENELSGRDRDRGANVDLVELRIVARHHPRADVPALLHRHVAPGLVAGLALARDRARAPELLAGLRVVRGDHARVAGRRRLALAARDDFAVDDDRPPRRARGQRRLEHLRLPDELAGAGVDRVHHVVRARGDQRRAPDRDRALRAAVYAFRILALVLPERR